MAIHILVPLDNSVYSAAAGEIALQLAAAQPSRVTALRVVNVRPKSGNVIDDLGGRLGFEPAVVSDEVAKERSDQAAALVADWTQAARARGIEANGQVEVGPVARTIQSEAQEADVVVMGLRGETEEAFPKQGGELASWIIQNVQGPVIFTTPNTKRVTSVALGYDGSEDSKHAVRAIRRLLAPLGVVMHAIHVSRDGTGGEVLTELADQLPGCTVQQHVVQAASVEDALLDKAREVGAELLVMGFRGRSAFRDFLFGTNTERVLMSGELAVMVTH